MLDKVVEDFYKVLKRKKWGVPLIAFVVVATIVFLIWGSLPDSYKEMLLTFSHEKTVDQELVTPQKTNKDASIIEMKHRAKIVADSILISGWEETGDYLGYMGQITGFYKNYKDRYPVESELYSKELSGWREYFEVKRKSGKSFSTYDIEGLKGLVKSGEEHLENIAKVEDN